MAESLPYGHGPSYAQSSYFLFISYPWVIPAVQLLDGFYVLPTPKSGGIKICMHYYSLGGATMPDYRKHPVAVQKMNLFANNNYCVGICYVLR